MEVSHKDDHITHAVITANETIGCKITENSAFFHMLSSTLYSNQKEAVVREVVCNAWDAHIEAGVDLPIEITLTDEKLTVKDHGKGIPKDRIGQIYGTYGESTKKHDGNQTGGFGLGSKAPWAYTEHFNVTSAHDGVKTIYNLNRSSADADGRPGITPIVSIPTTETGLTVEVNVIKEDLREFINTVQHIVINGGIKAIVNGRLLESIEYPQEGEFTLTNKLVNTHGRILLKYGNVIYPITINHPSIKSAAYQLEGLVNQLPQGWKLILLAPPHSISVTPSRESLSMQDHTIKTLQTLIAKAYGELNQPQAIQEYTGIALNKLVTHAANRGEWQTMKLNGSYPPSVPVNDIPLLLSPSKNTTEDFAVLRLMSNYPRDYSFYAQDFQNRFNILKQHGAYTNKGSLRSLEKLMPRIWRELDNRARSPNKALLPWFIRHVSGPVVRRLVRAGEKNIRIFRPPNSRYIAYEGALTIDGKVCYPSQIPKVIPLNDVARISLIDALSYVDPWVVLTHSKASVIAETTSDFSQPQSPLIVVVPRSRNKIEIVRKALSDLPFKVIDRLEIPEVIKREPKKTIPGAPTVSTPKLLVNLRKGKIYPPLFAALDLSDQGRKRRLVALPRLQTIVDGITDPTCYLQLSSKEFEEFTRARKFYGNHVTYEDILYYGQKCAVVTSDSRAQTLKDQGLLTFSEYVNKQVIEEAKSKKAFKEAYINSLWFITHTLKTITTEPTPLIDPHMRVYITRLLTSNRLVREVAGIKECADPKLMYLVYRVFLMKDCTLLPDSATGLIYAAFAKEIAKWTLPKSVDNFLKGVSSSPTSRVLLEAIASLPDKEDELTAYPLSPKGDSLLVSFLKTAIKAKE